MELQGKAKPVVQEQGVEALEVLGEVKVTMEDLGREQMGKIRDMLKC